MLQIKKLLFGLVASLALTAALLAAFSALILKLGALPGEIAGTIALAIGCVSVLAAAFFTARIVGEKGLLHGLVLAAVYIFLYLAVSLALYADADIAAVGVRTAAILLCGALGGVLGVGKKSKIRF
mgnify:FL=1